MPAPSVRYKILPARGDISALTAAIAAIDEGELCYALDEDQLYVKEGGVLVPAGIEEAPQDGIQYVRKDGAWEAVDVPPGTIIGTSADLPAEVEQGQQWYDLDSGRLFVYTGTEWVDASPDGGFATCTTSDDAPANASDGDLWYRTTDGRMYVYYEDDDSSQWVDANPNLPVDSDTWTRSGTTVSLVNSGDTVNLSGDLTVDTDTLYVDSTSGNVGIGTDSPDAKLHIATGSGNFKVSQFGSSSTDISNTVSSGVIRGIAQGGFRFASDASTEFARISSNGNVGIGTNSPDEKLSISGGDVVIGQASGADTGIRNYIKFGRQAAPKAAIGFINNDNNGLGDILFMNDANSNGSAFTDSSEVMRLTASGNVGIGVTVPSSKLEVDGQVRADNGTVVGEATPSYSFSGDGDTGMYRAGTNAIGFTCAGVRKMSIGASSFFVYTTATPDSTVSGFSVSSGGSLRSRTTQSNVTNAAAVFGGTLGSLNVKADGDCENTNGRYTQTSDIRIKDNVVDANSQWEDIKALRWVNYTYKPETNHPGHTQLGVVAQEAELISPGLVRESDTADTDWDEELKAEVGDTYKTVAYSLIAMKAAKGLQEAMIRIETLEAQNADLLARIEALEQA